MFLERWSTMPSTISSKPKISWESLLPDFELPDDPVGNIEQPLLAATLNIDTQTPS